LSSPNEKSLFYPILEQIFTAFVPLFNHCLSDLGAESYKRRRTTEGGDYEHNSEAWNMLEDAEYDATDAEIWRQYFNDEDITANFSHCRFKGVEYDDPEEEVKSKYVEIEEDPEEFVSVSDMKEDWEGWKHYDLGFAPDVTWQPPELKPEFCLNGKKCKVIVKLANIMLSPENPVYSGGSWHVESMLVSRYSSLQIMRERPEQNETLTSVERTNHRHWDLLYGTREYYRYEFSLSSSYRDCR